MTKRFFLTLFVGLMLCLTGVKAQYTIPWASQQPAWVFPIYIEDGNGGKDTIYLGYDLNSTFGIDTSFGEKWVMTDTSFYVNTLDFVDSVQKVDIQPSQFSFNIGTKNGVTPFKVSWDMLTFYSDSLPFADQDPLPRAQGELWWTGLVQTGYGFCSQLSYPILVTDTFITSPNCIRRDSVIFNWQFDSTANMPMDLFMTFEVKPWEGQPSGLGIKEATEADWLKVYPNPVEHTLFIELERKPGNYIYSIYDLLGKEIIAGSFQTANVTVNMRDLPRGIYLLQVKVKEQVSDTENVRKIIIKQ